jgi:hypothetical protein
MSELTNCLSSDHVADVLGSGPSLRLPVASPARVTRFASSPPSREHLTRRQVAKILKVTVHCVERWAERGIGPPFYKSASKKQARVGYRIEDVEDFQRRRERDRLARTCGRMLLSAIADSK